MSRLRTFDKRAWERELCRKRKAAGLCIKCGKLPPFLHHTRCETCHRKHLGKGVRAGVRAKAQGQPHPMTARARSARKRAIIHYGGKCAVCGLAATAFLTLDHVNNDGADHRRQVRAARHLGYWAVANNFPPILQVLCWNHNHLKAVAAMRSRLAVLDRTPRQKKRVTYQESYRLKVRAEVFAAYGGAGCACCGERDGELLTLDHINGGGNQARREVTGSGSGCQTYYVRLRQKGFPPGYQVLCRNCNCGRSVNGGVCPHQDAQEVVWT